MHRLSIINWKTVLTFIQSVHQMGHYQTRKRIGEMPLNASTQKSYALLAVNKGVIQQPKWFGIDYELYLYK